MSQMARSAVRAFLLPSPCFISPAPLWARHRHLLALDAARGKRWATGGGYGAGGPRVSGLKWSVAGPRVADPGLGWSRRHYRLIRDVGSLSPVSKGNFENLLQVGGAPLPKHAGMNH